MENLIEEIIDGLVDGAIDLFDPNKKKDPIKKKKFRKSIFAILCALVIIIIVFSSPYTLSSGEEAVITRMDEYLRTEDTAGLNFKIPFIDKVTKINVNGVRRLEFGFRSNKDGTEIEVPSELLMLTGDENLVNVEAIVQYTIVDPSKYVFNVKDQVDTLRVVGESEIRRCIANHSLDEVLTDNKQTIQQEITLDLQVVVDKYEMGIQINNVQLQDVNPPNEVQEAFRDVAGAKEDKESAINGASTYANKVVPEARGKASKIINGAQAYKEERIENAKGEVAGFLEILAKYQDGKEITRTRMYLETIEEVLPGLNKYIVDEGSGTVKFLPLTDMWNNQNGGEKQ